MSILLLCAGELPPTCGLVIGLALDARESCRHHAMNLTTLEQTCIQASLIR